MTPYDKWSSTKPTVCVKFISKIFLYFSHTNFRLNRIQALYLDNKINLIHNRKKFKDIMRFALCGGKNISLIILFRHIVCIIQMQEEFMSMKNSSNFIIAVLVLLGMSITACDKRSDVTRDSLSFDGINTEELLAGEDNLNELVGHLTFGQVLDLLGNSLKTLNTLAEQGYTTKEDYQTLLNILKNVHQYLLDEKAEYETKYGADPDLYDLDHPNTMSDLLDMAVKAKVGLLLNQVLKQAGSDCLTQNIYPMISYAMGADDEILKNALSGSGGISLDTLREGDNLDNLMRVANGLIDQDGKYKDIHNSIRMLDYLLKTEQNSVTIDDIRDLFDSLSTLTGPYTPTNTPDEEPAVVGPYNDDQKKLIWGTEKGVMKALRQTWSVDIQNDTRNLSNSLNLFLTSTDMADTLQGLSDVLSINQATLQAYVDKALDGIAPTTNPDVLKGLAPRLARIDKADIPGIAAGLNAALEGNMYGLSKDSSDVKISELRTLMYMMQEAGDTDNILNRMKIINLMSSPDDVSLGLPVSKERTLNMAEWTVGEVASALKYWTDDARGTAKKTPAQTLNWVLYVKKYQLLALKIGSLTIFTAKTYDGMADMMQDSMMDIFRKDNSIFNLLKSLYPGAKSADGILDPFPAFVELAGNYSNPNSDSWKTKPSEGETAVRHKLFSLFAPMMAHYWDTNTQGDMVNMMTQLNEINYDTYVPLKNGSSATFRQDNQGTVFKELETALKPAFNNRAGDTTGIIAPVLDLALRAVEKLDAASPPFLTGLNETSLLDAVINDLNMQEMDNDDQDNLIRKLFVNKDKENRTFITNAAALLNADNRDTIVRFASVMGKSLKDSGLFDALVDHSNQFVVEDYDMISPILSDLITTSTDSSDASTMTQLMDYLEANIDDEENPFVSNGKTLLFRMMDIQDATYNPAGLLTGTTPITGPSSLLTHLTGPAEPVTLTEKVAQLVTGSSEDPGLYDLTPLKDFLLELTASPDVIRPMLNSGGMMSMIMGGEEAGANYYDISIEARFIKALFTAVDNDGDGVKEDSVAYNIIKLINLNRVNEDSEFMQRILVELYEETQGNGVSLFKPGTEKNDNLILTFENLLNNISVK